MTKNITVDSVRSTYGSGDAATPNEITGAEAQSLSEGLAAGADRAVLAEIDTLLDKNARGELKLAPEHRSQLLGALQKTRQGPARDVAKTDIQKLSPADIAGMTLADKVAKIETGLNQYFVLDGTEKAILGLLRSMSQAQLSLAVTTMHQNGSLEKLVDKVNLTEKTVLRNELFGPAFTKLTSDAQAVLLTGQGYWQLLPWLDSHGANAVLMTEPQRKQALKDNEQQLHRLRASAQAMRSEAAAIRTARDRAIDEAPRVAREQAEIARTEEKQANHKAFVATFKPIRLLVDVPPERRDRLLAEAATHKEKAKAAEEKARQAAAIATPYAYGAAQHEPVAADRAADQVEMQIRGFENERRALQETPQLTATQIEALQRAVNARRAQKR